MSKHPMRILHYLPRIDNQSSGGVGAYMQLLARDLGKLCDLHILTHKSDNELSLENCHIHYMTDSRNPFSSAPRTEFKRIIEEVAPDVFHSNCCWLPLSARTAHWAHNLGYPVVYSPHGMLEPWIVHRNFLTKKLPALLLFQKRGLRSAQIIHATAESEKANLDKLPYCKNVHVIPNCVQIDGIQMKTSWEKKKKILFLSRVHVKKGINFLIEAVAQLRAELQGWQIQIAGPGDDSYVAQLKSQAKELNVDNIVTFLGPVFGEEKFQLYRDADLFVLPTHSENFGIVVTESLAAGTPVITTQGTPWGELPAQGCGWWIPVGTQPLVDALKEFLSKTDADLEEMGRIGRQLTEQEYSSTSVAKQFISLYENLVVDSSHK